jgi:sortase A
MSDDRRVDDLTLAELEAAVEERRRLERARQFAERDPKSRFRPITVEPLADMSPRSRLFARERAHRSRQRHWRDRLLLLIEVGAVLGLLAIIVGSLGSLQALNEEVVQAQRSFQSPVSARATEAPNGVLPGSSLPPADANLSELPGSSSPPEELPAALGVNVQSSPSLPPPTPGPNSPTRILISKVAIDWPIVEGDSWEELKGAVGHHVRSANPGERGNMVLSGHDDVFGEVFKDLDQLENGDLVQVFAGGHAFRYEVRAKRVVPPSELSVLDPTREPVVTLITCTPYRVDSMRLVVIAQLVP